MSTPHTTAQCERDEHDFIFPVDSYGVPMTPGRYCSNCDRCEHCFREDRALELLADEDDAAERVRGAVIVDTEPADYDADRIERNIDDQDERGTGFDRASWGARA